MAAGVLFDVMFRFAFVVVLGYALRRRGVITGEFQRILSELLLGVLLPLSVVAAGNSRYEAHMVGNIATAAVIALCYYAVCIPLVMLFTRALPMPGPKRNMAATLVILSNLAYFGFPIVTELYGAEGMLYAVIYSLVFQLVTYTFGVKLLGGEKLSAKFLLRPMTLAPVVAIALFVSPFRLPGFLASTFELVGGMSSPFALLIIGSSLATIKFASVWTDRWAWLVSALRLAVIPAAVITVLWAAGLRGVMPATMALLSSLSPATVNVIFAERYGHDLPFATRAVVQGTVLLVVFLPLTAWVVGQLLL